MHKNNIISKISTKLITSKKDFMLLLPRKFIIIAYLNPVNYFLYRKNPEILDKITYLHIDSIYMVSIFCLLLKKRISRLSFDMNMLASDTFEYCVKEKKTIFFVGGTENEIEIFINKIKKRFPDLKIIGYANGYETDEKILEKWELSGKSDFLIIGLGNLRQEMFLSKISERKEEVFCISCGAFISQTANAPNLYFYPSWIYKLNLRVLYRITKDIKITLRFIKYYPRAFIYVIYDYIKSKI